MYTERVTEDHQIGGILYPNGRVSGVYTTAWFDMSTHHRAACLVSVGTMTLGATVDVFLQEARDANGTGAQAIPGKAITQLDQVLGDGNNLCVIELRSIEMTTRYRYVRAVMTVDDKLAEMCTFVVLVGLVDRTATVPTPLITEIIP